jgi:hypothetical protein
MKTYLQPPYVGCYMVSAAFLRKLSAFRYPLSAFA